MFSNRFHRRGFQDAPWEEGPWQPRPYGAGPQDNQYKPSWEHQPWRGRHNRHPPGPWKPWPFPGPADFYRMDGDRRWAPQDCPHPPPPWDYREEHQRQEENFTEDSCSRCLPRIPSAGRSSPAMSSPPPTSRGSKGSSRKAARPGVLVAQATDAAVTFAVSSRRRWCTTALPLHSSPKRSRRPPNPPSPAPRRASQEARKMRRALLLPSQLVPARTACRAGRRWLRACRQPVKRCWNPPGQQPPCRRAQPLILRLWSRSQQQEQSWLSQKRRRKLQAARARAPLLWKRSQPCQRTPVPGRRRTWSSPRWTLKRT